jgi:hypothetical protein
MMKSAVDKKLRYIGLWRHEWQGVIQGVPNKLPRERTFIAPTPDQEAFDIRLLRLGLIKETTSADQTDSDNPLGVQ